jgi:hypothetical protein
MVESSGSPGFSVGQPRKLLRKGSRSAGKVGRALGGQISLYVRSVKALQIAISFYVFTSMRNVFGED